MKTLYEIKNDFEVRGSGVAIDTVNKTITIWDQQRGDSTYNLNIIEENKEDFLKSFVEVLY